MTNPSAMTALQNLQSINKNLQTTQSRISTGLRVSEAADNAAYWSIATTMRSDNKAMSTVTDALGLGAAQVDVAYTAMDVVKETLDEMKAKLVAASQPDIDKSKIQSELSQLQNNLKSYAEAATFSGGNWLSVSEQTVHKIVASFTRTSTGSINLVTIDINTRNTALFTADAGAPGLLQAGIPLEGLDWLAAGDFAGDDDPTDVAAVTDFAYESLTLARQNIIRFDIAVDGGAPRTVTIDRALVDEALGTTDGEIADAEAWAKVMEAALERAGVEGVTVDATTGQISTVLEGVDAAIAISNVVSNSNGNFFGATEFNITDATPAQIDAYLAGLDKMLSDITSAASNLGAIKNRVANQQDFVKKVMDAIDRGIGQLVDADMNQESTRLQALQVQQQLGVQALSIANANAQSILSLFRS